MKVDLKAVEEACKELYIRAVKILPPDIKEGFARLDKTETDATGKSVLGTMDTLLAAMLVDDGVRLPGERRHKLTADALANGLAIPDAVLKQLRELAA